MKYFYSLFAPLLLGIHLFSLKHIHNIYEKEKKINGLIIILTLFSFSLALLAKYFVFLDCKNNSIVVLQTILNCSVFVTLSLCKRYAIVV